MDLIIQPGESQEKRPDTLVLRSKKVIVFRVQRGEWLWLWNGIYLSGQFLAHQEQEINLKEKFLPIL